MAFSLDSKTLASESSDDTVKLWDASSGTALQTLKGHSGSVNAMAFSLDSKTLASESSDGTVKLWDAGSAKALQTPKGQSSNASSHPWTVKEPSEKTAITPPASTPLIYVEEQWIS
ncbi:hypothetical protein LTS09_016101 [Friedmanniomyces endolithicus]|nr:hypothetical protein LTS09_016101 [Friedmanniomyces endolithicus]